MKVRLVYVLQTIYCTEEIRGGGVGTSKGVYINASHSHFNQLALSVCAGVRKLESGSQFLKH